MAYELGTYNFENAAKNCGRTEVWFILQALKNAVEHVRFNASDLADNWANCPVTQVNTLFDFRNAIEHFASQFATTGILLMDLQPHNDVSKTGYARRRSELLQILAKHLRSTDLIVDCKNGQIAVMLPQANLTASTLIANRLQKALKSTGRKRQTMSVPIGISHYRYGDDMDVTLHHCSTAQSLAKAGRSTDLDFASFDVKFH